MADQVHGIGVPIIDNVQHLLAQLLCRILTGRGVDGFRSADAGQPQAFLGPQPVKLNPCVFPRLLFICTVGGDLPRNNQKSVPCRDGIGLLVGKQRALPGNHIVEQIVISGMGAVGMERFGSLPPELV